MGNEVLQGGYEQSESVDLLEPVLGSWPPLDLGQRSDEHVRELGGRLEGWSAAAR